MTSCKLRALQIIKMKMKSDFQCAENEIETAIVFSDVMLCKKEANILIF